MTDTEKLEFPPLLTIRQTARLLQMSTDTVYELANKRKLPGARKIGGSWRINRDSVLGAPVTPRNSGRDMR